MKSQIRLGIIGDYDTNKSSHVATMEAIQHAAGILSLDVDVTWIPTPSIPTENGLKELHSFDGLWASPGSPYKSMNGTLAGIRLAREMNKPFFGN